uniref:NADH-ubiquinone oxidoreductase chain 5 n=1 Tax=Changeondelphax velitchkovskyi TaxID=1291384 RepID=A0A343UJA4_9HEMI|nr:NADH dehydrogenase subunit 5 [Changeondelphax velitchkovskyi]AVC55482.1 NADH dehydrogenase subunit 5 [Changeondelphax velitchkovskyi]
MLFILNINFFFFTGFFLFFLGGMLMHLYNLSLILYYDFFFLNSCNFSLVFVMDWLSLVFLSVVFLISGCVFFYSLGYMSGDNFIVRFYFLVFLFVLSMFFLIMTPDLLCLMLGWDGLGLVSYCLVIYYQSSTSLSSGYLTLFINRLGDLFLILCICWCFNYGCWHYFYLFTLNNLNLYMLIFLILACLTKSAQFPFSSWLPAAMAAPTPVSSLVHSSTLVTAGVYLMIRFNKFLNGGFIFFLMNLSLLTILLSGLGALYENDLSKIVAFSTMGQLGFMIFCIVMGSYYLSFIHLLIHAVFKSLLFLCSGVFISGYLGVQDIRYMGSLGLQSPLVSSCFLISLFSLCGLPFYSGFFSKDFIIELAILSEINFFYFFIFFFSVYLTLIYSFRLFYFLFICKVNLSIFNLFNDFYMKFSCILLLMFSIFFGSCLFWLFDLPYVNVYDSVFSYMILFFMFYFVIFLNVFGLIFNLNSFLVYFFGQMWFLSFFSSTFIISKFFNFSHLIFLVVDSSWTEYLVSMNLVNLIKILNLYMNSLTLTSLKFNLVSFGLFLILMLLI